MIQNLKDALMGDHLTSWIASLAVLSWWWLPWLKDFSELAALLLPFLGGIWLGVQIWSKVFRGK